MSFFLLLLQIKFNSDRPDFKILNISFLKNVPYDLLWIFRIYSLKEAS